MRAKVSRLIVTGSSTTLAAVEAARGDIADAGGTVGDIKKAGGKAIDVAAAELIFGELLGNVVRHAPGLVEITLDWTAELPVLHVLDNGPGFQSRRSRERLPADALESVVWRYREGHVVAEPADRGLQNFAVLFVVVDQKNRLHAFVFLPTHESTPIGQAGNAGNVTNCHKQVTVRYQALLIVTA